MARPRRIALLARAVQPLHGVGGLERHVHDLVRHLTQRDVHVTLITRPPTVPGSDADASARFGVSADRFRLVTVPYLTFPGAGRRGTTIVDRSTAYPVFGWRAGRMTVRLVRQGAIDLVHALGASGLGYAMARRRHEPTVPFVFNPQGLEEFGATQPQFSALKRVAYTPLQLAVRTCANGADVVIATDRSLVDTVRRHLAVSDERIAVVPNAVDLEVIDRARDRQAAAEARRSSTIADDELLVLSVGRLEENKGFHVLARALGRLAARRPDIRWQWVLVGDGPFRNAIARAADEARIASRMIVPGRVGERELAAWYEAADVFAHPTLYEGSSLVTLEAMARGKPVVATRAGGLPDKVQPGVTGWLVDPGQADLLADALEEALGSSDARHLRGRAGRQLVEREFAWSAVIERLLGIYARLAGG